MVRGMGMLVAAAALLTASGQAEAQRYYSRSKLGTAEPKKPSVPTASCSGKGLANLYVSSQGQYSGGNLPTQAAAVKSCESSALELFNQAYGMKIDYEFACNIANIAPGNWQVSFTTAPRGQVKMVTDAAYNLTEGYYCTYSR